MESMLMENKQQRLYSLDFLKFLAAVMITNSHFQIVYENVNRSLEDAYKITHPLILN